MSFNCQSEYIPEGLNVVAHTINPTLARAEATDLSEFETSLVYM